MAQRIDWLAEWNHSNAHGYGQAPALRGVHTSLISKECIYSIPAWRVVEHMHEQVCSAVRLHVESFDTRMRQDIGKE